VAITSADLRAETPIDATSAVTTVRSCLANRNPDIDVEDGETGGEGQYTRRENGRHLQMEGLHTVTL